MPDREGDFARREFLTPLDAWSLANDDEVIGFDVGNLLGQPIRPADSQIDGFAVAEAQVQAPIDRRRTTTSIDAHRAIRRATEN